MCCKALHVKDKNAFLRELFHRSRKSFVYSRYFDFLNVSFLPLGVYSLINLTKVIYIYITSRYLLFALIRLQIRILIIMVFLLLCHAFH